MLQDLEAGKPLEPQQAGKRAPISEILYSALTRMDQDLRAKRL
jgi:hypothetical protein